MYIDTADCTVGRAAKRVTRWAREDVRHDAVAGLTVAVRGAVGDRILQGFQVAPDMDTGPVCGCVSGGQLLPEQPELTVAVGVDRLGDHDGVVDDQPVELVHQPSHAEACLDPAGRGATERREQGINRNVKRLQHEVNLLGNFLVALGTTDNVASQWAYLHGMAAPAWRLDPRITGVLVEFLDVVLGTLGGTDVKVRLGNSVPGM